MAKERLQKVLAAAGVDSRRKCEELILDGQVRVNKKIVDSLPAFVDTDQDIITVGSQKIKPAAKVYFLLNKPKGYICTNPTPGAEKKAVDLIQTKHRIYCVGRLDADTSGLILLTNDNELTNKLTHPKYKIPKTYLVNVKGRVEPEQVQKLKKGIWIAEGKTNPASVKILKKGYKDSALQITITQGLNRQIRRMLARVGLDVTSLKRTMIGKIAIKGIGTGNYKPLNEKQVKYLYSITEKI